MSDPGWAGVGECKTHKIELFYYTNGSGWSTWNWDWKGTGCFQAGYCIEYVQLEKGVTLYWACTPSSTPPAIDSTDWKVYTSANNNQRPPGFDSFKVQNGGGGNEKRPHIYADSGFWFGDTTNVSNKYKHRRYLHLRVKDCRRIDWSTSEHSDVFSTCKNYCTTAGDCQESVRTICSKGENLFEPLCDSDLRGSKYRTEVDDETTKFVQGWVDGTRGDWFAEKGWDGGTNRKNGGTANMLTFCKREPSNTAMRQNCDTWYDRVCGDRPADGKTVNDFPHCACQYPMTYYVPGWENTGFAVNSAACYVAECHSGIGNANDAYQPSNAFAHCAECTQVVVLGSGALQNASGTITTGTSVDQSCRITDSSGSGPPTSPPAGSGSPTSPSGGGSAKSNVGLFVGIGIAALLFFVIAFVAFRKKLKTSGDSSKKWKRLAIFSALSGRNNANGRNGGNGYGNGR